MKSKTRRVSIEEYRATIDAELDKITDFNEREDERIKLDDIESLNKLLFDTFVDEEGRVFKRIGFFSHNLFKLDLSGVSFDDVSFDGDNYVFPREYFSEKGGYQVDLRFTNAVIDFSKSYEFKRDKKVVLSRFNFHGTDLSNNNWHKLTQKNCGFVKFCSLRATDTKLSYKDENGMSKPVYLKFYYSDLGFLDLSDVRIDVEKQLTLDTEISFSHCGLERTGIKLEYYGKDKNVIDNIGAKHDKEKRSINPDLFRTSLELETAAKANVGNSTSLEEKEPTKCKKSEIAKVKVFISKQIEKIRGCRTAY